MDSLALVLAWVFGGLATLILVFLLFPYPSPAEARGWVVARTSGLVAVAWALLAIVMRF